MNPDGEITQFVPVVPAMSKRSAQVAANIERYERQWRTEHPRSPGGSPRLAERDIAGGSGDLIRSASFMRML